MRILDDGEPAVSLIFFRVSASLSWAWIWARNSTIRFQLSVYCRLRNEKFTPLKSYPKKSHLRLCFWNNFLFNKLENAIFYCKPTLSSCVTNFDNFVFAEMNFKAQTFCKAPADLSTQFFNLSFLQTPLDLADNRWMKCITFYIVFPNMEFNFPHLTSSMIVDVKARPIIMYKV